MHLEVSQPDSQRICSVGFRCFSEPEDRPYHKPDLGFLRPAPAHDRLLDPSWRVFVDCQTVLGSREQSRSASRPKRNRGSRVLDVDQTFDSTDFRAMSPDEFVNLTMNLHQTARHRQLRLVPDDSVAHRARAGSLSIKNRIPRVPERWVKS